MDAEKHHPEFVTVRAAAVALNVHENTVRNWIDRGLIEAERLPSGVRRIRHATVERVRRGMRSDAS